MGGSYSIDLKQVPSTILKYPEELSKHNIKVLNRPDDAWHVMTPVTVEFPSDWTCQQSQSGDCQEVTYYNGQGVPKLTISAKLTSYDSWAYINFLSEESSANILSEQAEQSRKRETVESFIANNFKREWSATDRYITYFHVDGSAQARYYFRGCENQMTQDHCDEFSSHKFIGYCPESLVNAETAQRLRELKTVGTLVFRELPQGTKNLRRFEMSHMFGVDPNIEYGVLGRSYNPDLYRPIVSPARVVEF